MANLYVSRINHKLIMDMKFEIYWIDGFFDKKKLLNCWIIFKTLDTDPWCFIPVLANQLPVVYTSGRIYFIYLYFISLIHQQSYQTVAAKGIQHADGKARPTGTYSFPDKLSIKTNTYSLHTTTTEK